MLSAVIASVHSYPAMRLASQPVHQRYVHSGPLVLGAAPVKSPAPTADRDQTVSRRFEPSSRTTLNGEQPYPWDRLQPQDVMSRHRGAKHRRRYELQAGMSTLAARELAPSLHSHPAILHKPHHSPMQSYSKGARGLPVLPRGDCISTNTSTSLRLGWRQCGLFSAIRAGRNFPDKEFR